MATDPRTIEILLELLAPLPLSVRKMFGEYSVYLDGKVVALVTDDVFSLKLTELRDERLDESMLGPAYPGSKPYWRIPADLLEDREWATSLVARTAELLPPPAPKRPRARAQRSAKADS